MQHLVGTVTQLQRHPWPCNHDVLTLAFLSGFGRCAYWRLTSNTLALLPGLCTIQAALDVLPCNCKAKVVLLALGKARSSRPANGAHTVMPVSCAV